MSLAKGGRTRLRMGNILIRQYIPKKSSFNDFSDVHICNVGRKLNLPRELSSSLIKK